MGFAISTVAVRGKSAEQVLAELELRRTGEWQEVPEAPLTCRELPNGWFVVFANDFYYGESLPLPRLSERAEVVVCQVEEHVMYCSSALWSDGALQWSVVHDAQQDSNHLEVEGGPPAAFVALRNDAENARADDDTVDYVFEVPVALAQGVTAFRYDESTETDRYEIVVSVTPRKKTNRRLFSLFTRQV